MRITQETINNMIEAYLSGSTINSIAKQLNLGHETVRRHLRNSGIKIRSRRKHQINEDYFKQINSPEKAWLLGFIIADGYITKGYNNVKYYLRIELSNKDKYILEHISNNLLESTYPVVDVPAKESSYLIIGCKSIVMDLFNIGLNSNKSNSAKFPEIDPNLHNRLIRGLFDGDGNIYIKSEIAYSWSLVGTEQLLTQIAAIIHKECCLKSVPIFRETNNNIGVGQITVTGRHQVKHIGEFLYKDATCYLQRKYNTFNTEFHISEV